MPITASLGALSYSRSALSSNFDYWFLETNSNITFNGATFDSSVTNFYVAGINSTTQKGLLLRINENNNYPQLVYNFDMTYRLSGGSPGTNSQFIDITYSTFANKIIPWGSFQANNIYAVNMPFTSSIFDEQPPPFGTPTPANRFQTAIGSNTLNTMTMCSLAPSSSTNDWLLYRDGNRLIYRNLSQSNYNVTGPLTYINASSSTDYIPQTILTDTTGNAVVTLNLSDLSNNDILIRRVNKTSVGTPLTYYPTIWQKTYSFGLIYQAVLDASNNIYFVSSDGSNSVIVCYDINGNLIWQRQINGVVLKGITYSSNYLYLCGSITSNNNLFVAKYNGKIN